MTGSRAGREGREREKREREGEQNNRSGGKLRFIERKGDGGSFGAKFLYDLFISDFHSICCFFFCQILHMKFTFVNF